MSANAAIFLDVESYDATMPRPMGRNSAGEGFLRAFLRYADVDRFHIWNVRERPQDELEALLARLGPVGRPVVWLGRPDRRALADAGALYIPSPQLAGEAWGRRAFGAASYSITGVTHTLLENFILDELASYLTAPMQPWDALVCTSDAGRRAVESLLEGVAGYLQDRFGATRLPPAQLVTIPLGVHTQDFRRDAEARARWRERLDIPPDAPVALHMGRFSLSTKLHPGPSGLALQQASERLGRPVYWLMFGGARRAEDEQAFQVAASTLAPDVRVRLAPDTSTRTRDELISAADVFLSLSDNLQETFGLTPVEAMAAGLPCVVSDWNGYRDTVRHGQDGFRIRTHQPRAGLGADLAYAFAQGLMTYDDYAGSAALLTAVDVGEAADALVALFSDADLRGRMGAAGQARAREAFDWRAIIPQYQALWAELGRRRKAAGPQPALDNPFRPDPFRMFAGHPTDVLTPDTLVMLARPLVEGEAAFLMELPGLRNAAARLPSTPEAEAILAAVAAAPRSVGALMAEIAPERRPFVERGIVWLAKFGFLRLAGKSPRN